MNKNDSVVIVSGGMDSVTLLHHLVKDKGQNPAVISFNYGQRHGERELECAKHNAKLLGIDNHLIVNIADISSELFKSSALVNKSIAVPTINDVMGDPQPITYVPNRNMIFLSIALGYAEANGASEVYYGAQKHDLYGYWDTTIDFIDAINNVMSLNRKNTIQIVAPFYNMKKSEILEIGMRIGVDYSNTWSCYKGPDKDVCACGICSTCAERLGAFKELNQIDPLCYSTI